MTGEQLLLTQGEVLMILCRRDKKESNRDLKDLAAIFGFYTKDGKPDHTRVSKLFNLETMPEPIIQRACELFGVSVDIFEQKTIDALADRLAALEMRVKILEAEKAQLSASVALCHVRLDQCEEEKQKLQKQN